MWQKVVKKTMLQMDFHACITTPCMYHHASKDLFVVVHVDDFLCSGEPRELHWLTSELEKQFELTKKFIVQDKRANTLAERFAGAT